MEILDKAVTAIAAYQPFYADLAKLEEDNSKITFDYESKKGNAEARSHIYKLRQSKGALERTRKEEKAESLKIGKAIDSEAAALEVRIEAMIKVHQTEIDKIEQREQARIDALKDRVQAITAHAESALYNTASTLAPEIAKLESMVIGDDFQEFKAEALQAKDARLQALRTRLTGMQLKEAEAAELARLRKEAAERAQADRDVAIAKEAAERATAEAERKAQEVAAAQQKAVQDAENKAAAERDAAACRELELKLAAETAERRRVEQEQAAAQEKIDAAARAEQQAARAVQVERERLEDIARAEAAELAKREANKAHKGRINKAALEALVAGGIPEEEAKKCIVLIASSKVPAVSIAY